MNTTNEKRINDTKTTNGKKALAIGLCLLLAAMALAGCSVSASSKTSTDYKGQTIFGEVTKVSSDSITVDVGTSKMPDGAPQGQPPEKRDNNNGSSDSNSSGSNRNGKPSMIEKNGESATLKIESNTTITKGGMRQMGRPDSAQDSQSSENADNNSGQNQEETIELSDIKEGDIVSITIDDSGKVTSVKVMSGGFMHGGPGKPGDAGNAGNSNEASDSSNSSGASDSNESSNASDESVNG